MAANPHRAPRSRAAAVAADSAYQPIQLWSGEGRIGRLRYFCYLFGAALVAGLVSGLVTRAFGSDAGLIIGGIPYVVFFIVTGIKRSHDMDFNGWTVVLSALPGVGLFWIFGAGTSGPNHYGDPPPPNTTGVKVMAFLFIVIVLIGTFVALTARSGPGAS